MGAISWGEAIADTLVQGPLMVLTLIGILQRRPFGFVTGVTLMIIWIYASMMLTAQRIGLYHWAAEPDLSRAAYVGAMMFGQAGSRGSFRCSV